MHKMSDQNGSPSVYKNGVWIGPQFTPEPDYFQFGEKLCSEMKGAPNFVGQIDAITGEKETFAAMLDRSIRCAIWLKKHGVKSGDVVGYCSKNNLDSFAPVCAASYIAAIFNPWWDSSLDRDIIKYFIDFSKPKVIFADEVSAKMILSFTNYPGPGEKIIVFGSLNGLESFRDIIATVTPEDVNNFRCTQLQSPHTPAIIMYTSGTTGNPKGALYSYGSFVNMLESLPFACDGEQELGFWCATLCWISGIGSLVRSIIQKSTSIIHNCATEEEACQIIEKFGATWLMMGTAFANRLSKTDAAWRYDLSTVDRVTVGGGVLKSEVALFLKRLFLNSSVQSAYGTTELGAVTAGFISPEKSTISGKVTRNYEIKVINPDTNETLGPNQAGELCVRGVARMMCYWNNPQSTAEVIDMKGWCHTGDLGHYDEDGDFYITERIKEFIKYRLHHVAPAVIESVIQEHPDIGEVGVVGKPDNDDLEQPLAFVTKRSGAKVTEKEIMELVANKLHDRMKLRGGVCFLEEMPRTASGKIAKSQLRALARTMKKPGITFDKGVRRGSRLEHPQGYWKYGEKILKRLRQYPDNIGQVDAITGIEDTYRCMEDRSVRCALWLAQQCVKPGDVIALCTHNQLDSTIPMLAALFSGVICNPWWEAYLEEDLITYFLVLTKPKIIFANQESAPVIQTIINKVRADAKVIVLGKVPGMQSLQDILDAQNNEAVARFQCTEIETADAPALLIYTSGSTGKPKSVLLSYGSLTNGVGNEEADGTASTRGFWGSSFCWISAVIAMMVCLIKGATAVIYPAPTEEDICRLIEEFKINWALLGTGVINRLCNTKAIHTCDTSSMKLLFFSGAIVKHDIEEFLLENFPNAGIYQAYGATELGGGCTLSKVTEDTTACSCGKPTNNVEMKVVDASTGAILGPNQEGEICIRSPYVMKQYFKNPEATARVLDSEGWYHSDDLGYYDEEGNFYIIDRLKELIKCKLFDIAPGPIEKCIRGHKSVAEAAVVAKPYSLDREQPMAFVTKLPGKEVTEAEIMQLVELELSDKMKLSGGVQFLDEMPYTASGKIAKKNLRDLARLMGSQ